ncbi:mycofactocin-coupled SDR family oxidoreductase [Streptomyces sp. NPDC051572]|uniref:mycofactocin-coupled SDR family oxidoreductase n=1 Tax=unclassified Streptomyces TaxID=2593676 RepID=UPI00344DE877
MTGRVAGKVAVITGAARGQGRSHALRLAAEGADIIAIDFCEDIASNKYPLATSEDLAQTVKQVEALGRRVFARQADVRDRAAVRGAIDAGVAELGHLDVVVANAGICPLGPDGDVTSLVDAVQVDFGGVVNAIEAALPHLGAGASIIATGSVAAMTPGAADNPANGPGGVGYAWAKQAIATFVHTLALQLAPQSIRANVVHPTNVNTDMLQSGPMYRAFRPDLENPTREDAEQAFPVTQTMPIPYVESIDISNAVLFLASDEARYITGVQLKVDGGSLLRQPYPAMG